MDEAFAAYLQEHRLRRADAGRYLDDLRLAFLVLQGNEDAIAHFERLFIGRVAAYTAHLRLGARSDDLQGILRDHLLPPPSGVGGKLALYSGSAPLDAWVRTTTIRLAADSDPTPAQTSHHAPDDHDPMRDALRLRYQGLFKTTLLQALSRLPVRERNVFRMHYVESVPLQAIARAYQVDRTTLFRWLKSAHAALRAHCKDAFCAQAGVDTQEFESLLSVLESQLDFSIGHAV